MMGCQARRRLDLMGSQRETLPGPVHRGRRLLAWLGVFAAVLVVAALGIVYLAQPQRASTLLLDRVGNALGLSITASGPNEYRLRGTPQLVLRNVVALRPGDSTALLRAERVLVSLPWSTVRARGRDLTVQRVELDGPVLDLAALQRWQASRPPAPTRIPTLRDGLRVVRGRLIADGWSIDGIDLALPALAPGRPLHARLRGRYLDAPRRVPFDLTVAMTAPANGAGFAALGTVSIEGGDWTIPGQVRLSGPLRLDDGDLQMAPAKLGFSGRYRSASSNVPFVLGAFGPLNFAKGVWALAPASFELRGAGAVPQARAAGAVAFGRRLAVRIQGTVARWPEAWPALPPPLSASTSPMGFALDYTGRVDFSDVADLRLSRDQTAFDARFRLPQVRGWLDAGGDGSPLPPLDGHLRTPRLEVAGAQLEGVEIRIDDPSVAPTPESP